MMNDIKIFQNPDFGEIRTVIIDGEPWFVGNDVAKPLGYSAPKNAVAKFVDDEDKQKHQFDSTGQNREMVIINESGLYSLIFGSKMENAKKFKKWVTSEVLPSIRRTGTYGQVQLPQTTDGKIALLAQGHTELKAEVDEIKADLQALKLDLPLMPVEADELSNQIKKRGVEILGGKSALAYNDRSIRQKLYNNYYFYLKQNFNVSSYKAIKRNRRKQAMEIIEEYKPPLFLKEMIDEANTREKSVSDD